MSGFWGFRSVAQLGFSLLCLATLSACHSPSGNSPTPVPLGSEITKDNYLSGTAFCQTYASVTGLEYGRYITVPKDYSHPENGSLQIYVYTLRAFDPHQASYIFVDGGPGQNTHGIMPEFLHGTMNEMRFDQRGLGCSAPATWEEYKDTSLYSSANNVRDMEEIRKAFGIQKWSVYGVSYGTVPSTMYGHDYAKNLSALVLEGTVSSIKYLQADAAYSEKSKFNRILDGLNSAQRSQFGNLWNSNEQNQKVLHTILESIGDYHDDGENLALSYLQQILNFDGSVNKDNLSDLTQRVNQLGAGSLHPQKPGAIDVNILNIIYCKNLGAMQNGLPGLGFNQYNSFTVIMDAEYGSLSCGSAGVQQTDVDNYEPQNFPVDSPVYYFQGEDDGATLEPGAVHHWQTVPQNQKYFLLAKKGGHNPNLTRIAAKSQSSDELTLFSLAVNAQPISTEAVAAENSKAPTAEPWKLYLAKDTPPAVHAEDLP